MKINPEQINQIARESATVKKNKKSSEFGKMLEQEISRKEPGTELKGSASSRLDILHQSQLLGSSLLTSQKPEPTFMNQMDSLLNMWENYAADIGSPDSSLKNVYAHLQDISQGIKDMKQSSAFESQHPQVKSVLKELEVLTTTEMIKFNRGDYIA